MPASISAPLITHTSTVLPEWIDYNGHMMDGYYFVAFTYASEGFLNYVGLGPAYLAETGQTIYTVEGHINFLHEVKVGAQLKFTTQLLAYDAKRLHVFHQMHHVEAERVAATNELMFVHFDTHAQKVGPLPAQNLDRVMAVHRAHSDLPRPPQAGRSIGLTQRAT